MCMVYLPTWMVEFYDRLVSKYTGLVPMDPYRCEIIQLRPVPAGHPSTPQFQLTTFWPIGFGKPKAGSRLFWPWSGTGRSRKNVCFGWEIVPWLLGIMTAIEILEWIWMNQNLLGIVSREPGFFVAPIGAGFNACAWVMCRQFVVQPWNEEFRVTGHGSRVLLYMNRCHMVEYKINGSKGNATPQKRAVILQGKKLH